MPAERRRMDENEWLSSTAPARMLGSLPQPVSPRKLRLFAAACLDRYRERVSEHDAVRTALRVARRLATGACTNAERTAAIAVIDDVIDGGDRDSADHPFFVFLGAARSVLRRNPWNAAIETCHDMIDATERAVVDRYERLMPGAHELDWECSAAVNGAVQRELVAQSDLVREVIGVPARPVMIERRWVGWDGGVIPGLAAIIDEDGAFERLPVLADMLEEAGCTTAELLAHCRRPGGHVRGCWAVDFLLDLDA